MQFVHGATDLRIFGVATIPVFTEAERQNEEESLWNALDSFPEYIRTGKRAQRVLGAFGAYGNPSSFHHPNIRRFRKNSKKLMHELFTHYVRARFQKAKEIRLEALFDRVCVRCSDFGSLSGEDWHRDIYSSDEAPSELRPLPTSLPGNQRDLLFGGWTNLSDQDQAFVCLLKTHNEPFSGQAGFAKFSKQEIVQFGFESRLKSQANSNFGHTLRTNASGEVIVKPGHAIVFLQQLIHAVKGGKQPAEPALRVFHGYRLTTEDNSLFHNLRRVLQNGEVPRIPSGQIPAMYSQNHYQFFATTPKCRGWGELHFKPECLFERTVTRTGEKYYTPGSSDNRNIFANKTRSMPSLAEMGLWDTSYAYTAEEADVYLPELVYTREPDFLDHYVLIANLRHT